jgi:hypothetical protein
MIHKARWPCPLRGRYLELSHLPATLKSVYRTLKCTISNLSVTLPPLPILLVIDVPAPSAAFHDGLHPHLPRVPECRCARALFKSPAVDDLVVICEGVPAWRKGELQDPAGRQSLPTYSTGSHDSARSRPRRASCNFSCTAKAALRQRL